MDLEGADLTNATALLPVATAATSAGFSQSGEDLHAYATYFYGCHNGTFLEMGGLDGAPPCDEPEALSLKLDFVATCCSMKTARCAARLSIEVAAKDQRSILLRSRLLSPCRAIGVTLGPSLLLAPLQIPPNACPFAGRLFSNTLFYETFLGWKVCRQAATASSMPHSPHAALVLPVLILTLTRCVALRGPRSQ